MGVEGDAGVITQAIRAIYQLVEPGTFDDVDISRAVQVATAVGVQAVAGSFHAVRFGGQGGWEIERGREVTGLTFFPQQPDPARVQIQQSRHMLQRRLQRIIQLHRAIQGIGDGVEDGQFPVALFQPG